MAKLSDYQNDSNDKDDKKQGLHQGRPKPSQHTVTAPQGTTTAPQGTAVAPQGTASAPQGTATAPQGTATAPQGTATAPQGTATPPFSGGGSGYHGAQADIIVQDGRVLKVYKPGMGFNAAVLPLVKKLYGKGYVVDLYDYGTMDYQGEQRQFELMEYCPAGAVSAVDLKGNKEAILTIAVKTALAIDACHRAGFIHKDVKPANILIRNRQTWDCVLCDFGIADVLDHGKVSTLQARTPIYAAPEMYERTATIGNSTYCELTPAADFYSLGMTILCLWYGESAFRNKETVMAIQKVHDGIIVPADMPDPLHTITRGLLVKDPEHRWGLKEIQDFLKGVKVEVYDEKAEAGLNIVFNSSKSQVAHSLEELAAFMVEDMDLAIKYLYSGRIYKWLEKMPELQVEIEKIVEDDYADDQNMGFLAAVHLLNPFYDLNLCCDTKAPAYAMTGEAIGRLLNEVYYLYYTKYCTDYNAMLRQFDDDDRQKVRSAEVAYNIVYSFENGGNSDYVPWFFDHKGNRFVKQRKWFDYCVLQQDKSKKKAGPKDKAYLNQVGMMRTIAGFGAAPQYRLSRTGQVLTTLDDVYAAPKQELKYDLEHDKGIRGWLAVKCHEDPNADLKRKFDYERLLEKYVGLLGYIDSNNENYRRFKDAQTQVQSLTSGAKNDIRSTMTRSVIQKIFAFLAFVSMSMLFIDIVLNLIDNPVLDLSKMQFQSWPFYTLGFVAAGIAFFVMDSDGCIVPIIVGLIVSFAIFMVIKFVGWIIVWIYAVVVLTALIFFSVKTLFASSPGKQSTSSVVNPGFEELTLEPLHYAFNNDKKFDSSLNGVINSDTIDLWRSDIKRRRSLLLAFIGSAIVLSLFKMLLPSSERMDRFDEKWQHGTESVFGKSSTSLSKTLNLKQYFIKETPAEETSQEK